MTKSQTKVSLFQRIDFLAKRSTFAFSYHLDCLETILVHLMRRQIFSGKFHSIFYNICDLVVWRIIIKSSSRCRFWNRQKNRDGECLKEKLCQYFHTRGALDQNDSFLCTMKFVLSNIMPSSFYSLCSCRTVAKE